MHLLVLNQNTESIYLFIYAFTAGTRGAPVSLAVGLERFQCEVIVEATKPCSHVEKITCYRESQISSGKDQWSKCTEPALQPFVYTICKHSRQENCSTFYEWTQSPQLVPKCAQTMSYVPPCGHECNVKCWERLQYTCGVATYKCNKMVTLDLPRCGHSLKVHCSIASSLHSWSGTPCETVGQVIQGVSYGTKDYDCKEKVTFIRSCGHEEIVPCGTAFDYASAAPKCTVKKEVINPVCGHPCLLECHEAALLSQIPRPPQLSPVTEVDEKDPQRGFVSTIVKTPLCNKKVTLRRVCGHHEEVLCCQSRSIRPCHAQVQTKSPLCGHNLKIQCSEDLILRSWKPWEASGSDRLVKKLFDERVLVESVPRFNPPPASIQRLIEQCNFDIKVQRDKTCGHFIMSKCSDAFKAVQHGHTFTTKCFEKVLATLFCGHTQEFVCWENDAYKRDPNTYVCKEEANRKCWNFNVCKKTVVAPCSMAHVACSSTVNWTCPTNSAHIFPLELCSKGIQDYILIM